MPPELQYSQNADQQVHVAQLLSSNYFPEYPASTSASDRLKQADARECPVLPAAAGGCSRCCKRS